MVGYHPMVHAYADDAHHVHGDAHEVMQYVDEYKEQCSIFIRVISGSYFLLI